jgi:uncharacterized membrane protein (UPF0127 family)
MRLKNTSKEKLISSNLKVVKSIIDLTFGLLLKSNPRSLLFNTRFGIHTFGLKSPIDVIILADNFRVVKMSKNLKPNCLFFWNPKYSIVLELPANSIEKSRTMLSDKLMVD